MHVHKQYHGVHRYPEIGLWIARQNKQNTYTHSFIIEHNSSYVRVGKLSKKAG